MSVKPAPAAGGSRQLAVFGSSPPAVDLHGSFIEPAIGSNVCATCGLPPAEVNVFSAGSTSRTSPGWIASQLGALNGPPDGASPGQVCVSVSTPSSTGTDVCPLT